MSRLFRFVTACCLLAVCTLLPSAVFAQAVDNPTKYIRVHYTRQDHRIPMRDGSCLYTVVYAPKDTKQTYPIMMLRTPYSVGPYEPDKVRGALGPNPLFLKEGYIFAYQDVRGCFMSEGEFENMRPHRSKRYSPRDIDESTDTFDTIDWLVKNLPNNNGKVGLWGISYPGFYASAGMIDAHPALQAVSPQAPIADWFFDDFNHHGAFFLTHAFNFFSTFGQPRPEPTPKRSFKFDHGTPDGYQFFLEMGPLQNVNRHYKHRVAYWNRFVEHPNYDSFWQARNILPHLRKVAPAVMTVGGWFDAEDLYGPLQTYRAVEKQNPGIFNILVMGPWAHGAWSRTDSSKLGHIHFGANPSTFYHKDIELAFFNHFLKGKGENKLAEAVVFETGQNRWRQFAHWPPTTAARKKLYLGGGGSLRFQPPTLETDIYDEYPSDPRRPVPYTEIITTRMTYDYMTEDQRFASRRPDVLVYQTEPLAADLTLAGPIQADLWVATSGTDSDWVVKVIDVFPGNTKDSQPTTRALGGYQMLVRSEVIRGRFRNSYEKPEPFVANQPARVLLALQDVLHTFRKGHRLMVQIHSSWFPLVDRNPQKYLDNIFLAEDKDFLKTTQRVYRSPPMASHLEVGILNKD